jgi:hypothetical protein
VASPTRWRCPSGMRASGIRGPRRSQPGSRVMLAGCWCSMTPPRRTSSRAASTRQAQPAHTHTYCSTASDDIWAHAARRHKRASVALRRWAPKRVTVNPAPLLRQPIRRVLCKPGFTAIEDRRHLVNQTAHRGTDCQAPPHPIGLLVESARRGDRFDANATLPGRRPRGAESGSTMIVSTSRSGRSQLGDCSSRHRVL